MVGSGKGTIWQTTFGHRIGTDGQESPLLVNLKPSGEFLMEDFFYAGGLPAVLENIKDIIDGDAPTVTGQPFSSYADPEAAATADAEVIRTTDHPILADSGIAVLRGNLCPGGAVIKPNAATPALMKHRGRAVVFESIEDYHTKIDDPDLDVNELAKRLKLWVQPDPEYSRRYYRLDIDTVLQADRGPISTSSLARVAPLSPATLTGSRPSPATARADGPKNLAAGAAGSQAKAVSFSANSARYCRTLLSLMFS